MIKIGTVLNKYINENFATGAAGPPHAPEDKVNVVPGAGAAAPPAVASLAQLPLPLPMPLTLPLPISDAAADAPLAVV